MELPSAVKSMVDMAEPKRAKLRKLKLEER
jgi:hypothetical protein